MSSKPYYVEGGKLQTHVKVGDILKTINGGPDRTEYIVNVLCGGRNSFVQDSGGVRSKASYFAIDTDRKRYLTRVFTEGCQIGEECPRGDKYIRDYAGERKPRKNSAGKEFGPTRIYEPEPGVPGYARYKFEFKILKKESLRLELAKGLNARLVVDSPLKFLEEAKLFERIANYIARSIVFVIYPEEGQSFEGRWSGVRPKYGGGIVKSKKRKSKKRKSKRR